MNPDSLLKNPVKALMILSLATAIYAGEQSKPPIPETGSKDSSGARQAAKTPQEEVEHLFQYLRNSGCRFNRNGTWYSNEKAVDHLRRKYAYLVKKGIFTTAESFIEKGASASSMSGTPYKVQCDSAPPVLSGPWLTAELQRSRSTHP